MEPPAMKKMLLAAAFGLLALPAYANTPEMCAANIAKQAGIPESQAKTACDCMFAEAEKAMTPVELAFFKASMTMDPTKDQAAEGMRIMQELQAQGFSIEEITAAAQSMAGKMTTVQTACQAALSSGGAN